jgi:hypothetical protein
VSVLVLVGSCTVGIDVMKVREGSRNGVKVRVIVDVFEGVRLLKGLDVRLGIGVMLPVREAVTLMVAEPLGVKLSVVVIVKVGVKEGVWLGVSDGARVELAVSV